MSLTDSPSLIVSTSTCKSWNQSILGATRLFRQFKMEGMASDIIEGIKVFGERSKNSIKSIHLRIQGRLDANEKKQLQDSISPSSKRLELLSVFHQGELSKTILEIASECKGLVSLSSFRMGSRAPFHVSSLNPPLQVPSNWKPKLRRFEWMSGGSILVCDQALSRCLQDADSVNLCTQGVSSRWVVRTLSSNPNLVRFQVPWMEKEVVQSIPLMVLPELKYLLLDSAPSSPTGNGIVFFENLRVPKLEFLKFFQVDPKDLEWIQTPNSIKTLRIEALLGRDIDEDEDVGDEEVASVLVQSMKDWKNLSELQLKLPNHHSSLFWNRFCWLLTPLGRENIQAGYKNHFLFPNLESINLGRTGGNPVSSMALAAMVSARDSVSRRLSCRDVLLCSQGDLEAASAEPPDSRSNEDVPFRKLKISSIENLGVQLPIEGDQGSLLSLYDEFPGLR